ncbi:uncharacterized protein LOC144493887 [Mustelus asterias]
MDVMKCFNFYILFAGSCICLSEGQIKATIFLDPWLEEIVKGENLTINCTVDTTSAGNWFYLYKNNGTKYQSSIRTSGTQQSAAFRIQAENNDYYMCGCSIFESEVWKKCARSEQVNITVIDDPKTPSLSLNGPFAVLLPREFVKITCELSLKYSCSRMYIFRNGEEVYNASTTRHGLHRTSSYNITATISETYTCLCAISISGSWLKSGHSEKINISVIDRPEKPAIRLNESRNVFLKAENFSIHCAGGFQHPAKTFCLYNRNNGHFIDQKKANNGLNLVIFQRLASTSEQYWCSYQVEMSGRLIDSTLSAPVNVSVIGRPKKPEMFLNSNFTTFIKGEVILLTCNTQIEDSNKTFYLYKMNESTPVMRPIILRGNSTAMFNLTEIINYGVQQYRCIYYSTLSGQRVDSVQSNPIVLTVIGG